MNAPVATLKVAIPSLEMSEAELIQVLQGSVYAGAKLESIKLVIGYCRAGQLDPLQKPVHIVSMDIPTGKKDADGWDITEKRDVIMPGVGLYRIQAARTNLYSGITEPEFGPDVTEALGETKITYPAWCKIIVFRIVGGKERGFTAIERWIENYATKGRKADPNKMWKKRPYGQLSKCAEAQALRKAFPEFVGAAPTAEEMEGKTLDADDTDIVPPTAIEGPKAKSEPAAQVDNNDQFTAGSPKTPPADSQKKPAAEKPANGDKPLSATQQSILRKSLERAALNELDISTKFGVNIDGLKASQYNDVADWIKSRSAS